MAEIRKLKKKTKDGRSWVFRTSYVNITGEKKYYQSKAYFSKFEAKVALEEFEKHKNNYANVTMNMTFKELYTKYYEYQKDNVKDSTLSTYLGRARYMKILDNVKIKDLDGEVYNQWRQALNDQNLTSAYKNDIQKFIKNVLNWGHREYNLDVNQFYLKLRNFKNKNEIPKKMDFYSYEEYKLFSSVIDDPLFKCIFDVFYFMGLRRGELRALNWNDINFKTNQISITKTFSKKIHGKGEEITDPKTKASIRTLAMPKIVFNELSELKEKVSKYKNYKDTWFVFGNNKSISNYTLRTKKIQFANKANLKQIRLHDFRHSCASLLIHSGASIVYVSEYLGHSETSETLDTYSHVFNEMKSEVTNKIDSLTDGE